MNEKFKAQVEEVLMKNLSMGEEVKLDKLSDYMNNQMVKTFCNVLKSMKKANHISTCTRDEANLLFVIKLLYRKCVEMENELNELNEEIREEE